MNNEIIDRPDILSLQAFLADRETLGIYIPAYQRDFSWGHDQFLRFFEDVTADIRRGELLQHYMTFIGSLICFDDDKKLTIAPGLKSEQPERVYNIVDGQQRMIFINLLSTLLHKTIGIRYKDVLRQDQWFEVQGRELQKNLKKIISVNISGKEESSPKIIRAIIDEWARTTDREQHHSPSAHFLSQYLKWVDQGRQGTFECSMRGVPDELMAEHDNFHKHVKQLERLLIYFCKQTAPKDQEIRYELTSVDELAKNELLMQSAFSHDVSEDYKEGRFDFTGPLQDKKEELFRALLLGNYIYRCVHAIIVVTKRSYESTLSVFDVLNVTGRPLNAFDTFKPDVTKLEIKGYRDSQQKAYIDRIEAGIKQKTTRKAVDKYVSELIVSFAMANDGTKLGKDLHDQRNYLRTTFSKNSSDKEQYLEYLSFLNAVSDMKGLFETKEKAVDTFISTRNPNYEIPSQLSKDIGEASFCLGFLRRAGFKIAIPLLSVYLYPIYQQHYSEETISQFCGAVRKIASFCAIWRSSAESTNRIDDRVRKILQGKPPKTMNINWRPLYRFDYRKKERIQPLSMEELSRAFKDLIAEMYQIQDAETWSELAGETEIYKNNAGVAQFILLVGSHRTRVVMKDGEPFMESVKEGVVPDLISRDGFHNPLVSTIEHIIPQNEDPDKAVYSKSEKNQLWNLTLVPADVNSILGNKDWKRKQAIYRYYSSETEEEQQKNLKELENVLSKEQLERFQNRNHGYLPMTKYLAMLDVDDFTKEHGEKRSKAILRNCWRILAEEWLGW